MKFVFILLLLIQAQILFCQSPADSINNKAFAFFFKNENLDSALEYYKYLQLEYPKYNAAYITYMIGSCFLEKGDSLKAKPYLIKSLALYDTSESYGCSICGELGDIYLSEEKYQEILNYYDSSIHKYSVRPYVPCRYSRIKIHGRMALCLGKLNQTDSAINILAKYMFEPFDDVREIDSLDYEKMTTLYISLLRKLYSDKMIIREFKNALHNLVYKRDNNISN